MKSKKRLLPLGFYDLDTSEAKKNYEYTKLTLESFMASDYELIKTSLVEFEEYYDERKLKNTFKVVDNISGKNLFFRDDITTQISKYISSRDNELKMPIKLCYYGDVICVNSDEIYRERQQTQVGCEIIGSKDIKACFEVIKDTLIALDKIKINDLNISISLPDFLEIFLKNIDVDDKDNLKEAIINKRISDIKVLAKDYNELISEIVLENNNFENLDAKIRNKFSAPEIINNLNNAKELMIFLQKNFTEIKFNFDLFGDNKFSYHTKIAFDIFAGDFRYPIAKGGCYLIECLDKKIDAVGSTIYVNFLRKI
jgi:ATP phosphoribosyltransferase regulatory subunit